MYYKEYSPWNIKNWNTALHWECIVKRCTFRVVSMPMHTTACSSGYFHACSKSVRCCISISLLVIGMCCEWRFSISLFALMLKYVLTKCTPLKTSNTFWYLLILTHQIKAYGILIHSICVITICLKVAISLVFDWVRKHVEIKLVYMYT